MATHSATRLVSVSSKFKVAADNIDKLLSQTEFLDKKQVQATYGDNPVPFRTTSATHTTGAGSPATGREEKADNYC
jgi:hypothetical protein